MGRKADPRSPNVICAVTGSPLSVARHYGGCRYNGEDYTYFVREDILVRNDWVPYYRSVTWKEFKEALRNCPRYGAKPPETPKRPRRPKPEDLTGSLFD